MPPTDPGIQRLAARQQFEIVAMAASAGGLAAVTHVLARLPANFGAIVVFVQHLDPRHRSLMPEIMSPRSKLPVKQAEDGMDLESGHVYLAPPDNHLLVNRNATASLTHTELVNFVRPS